MTELAQTSLTDYIAALAARKSTPGGGSVAAISSAQAAALIQMVASFTGDSDDIPPLIERVIENATQAREQFLLLAEQDMFAFQLVMQAYRSKDKGTLQAALKMAAGTPIKVIAGCVALLEDITLIARIGNQNLITDTAIAADLLASAIRSSELNVLINLRQISDPAVRDELKHSLNAVGATLDQLVAIVEQIKQSFENPQVEWVTSKTSMPSPD